MTTLLAVYNSEGCVGRCDARCYTAKVKLGGKFKMQCTCICGGRNHAVGRERVSAEVSEDDIGMFRQSRPHLHDESLVVINRLVVKDAKKAREEAFRKIGQLDMFEDTPAWMSWT